MDIIAVTTTAQAQSFLDMVQIIYQNDPVYVRPLDIEINNIFNPATNNFHQHGEAARWILKDGDKTIGRVAAFINQKKAYSFEQPTGGMGFFECINDATAANLLLDTARNWLQARGMEAMDGPINFGERDSFWGLMIKGWEFEPTYKMPWTKPYYISFFENFGFKDNTITNTVADAISLFETTGTGYFQISGTAGVVLPIGDNNTRPIGVTGMIRFNTNDKRVELYDGTQWVSVAGATAGISFLQAEDIAIEKVLIFG